MNLGQILAQMKEAHREFERNNKHNFELFIIIFVAFPGQGHALKFLTEPSERSTIECSLVLGVGA